MTSAIMLSEARKREKIANAFLLATLAASAAQSPKDFVRTGHIESPGTALMQTFGKKRGEAERNLDHGRVVPRNRKKKSVTEEKLKKLKKWWNKGRNKRVPDENKASWGTLMRDDAKQITRTDKAFKSKEGGIRGWRPLKAFSPEMIKTGPTPAVRQAVERPIRAAKKTASVLLGKGKKKTFNEFVEPINLIEQSREEAERKRLAKPNPDEWRVRNTGGGKWTTKRKSSISGQSKRRSQRLKGLNYNEILAYVKRNLKGSPAQLAKAAQKIEREQKAAQTREARKKTKETGIKHVVDHKQPQQDKRKPENRERFERVAPGDVSSNRQVRPEPENLAKGSKPPKKGEPGYGTTRSGAIKKVVNKAEGQ